jgi:hypothetical protein
MANVTGKQDFVGSFSWKIVFSVRQMPVLQRGIDQNFVRVLPQLKETLVAQTKTPRLLVIARSVRNPLRMVRQGKNVRLQFIQGHRLSDGLAVADDMQVAGSEVGDFFAFGGFYVRVPDVPFLRDNPIEYRRACGNFSDIQRNVFLQDPQRLSNPVPRDAAANRVETDDKLIEVLAEPVRRGCRSRQTQIPFLEGRRSI